MKAVVWTAYGAPDVLQLREVEKPTPKDNEILIKIRATTVCKADSELRGFSGFSVFWLPLRLYIGVLRPTRITILGQELAGEVEAAGKGARLFKEGDQVFGASAFHLSANAEYICLPETALLELKPANISYEEAAASPLGGPEAMHFLRRANIQRGQKVLIIGAGGSIGSFGVQIARHFGAEVTGVDSTEKLDMMRSIGAERVIDYTREDFTRNGQTYDVIFDAPGKSSSARSEKSLRPNGLYLSANPALLEQMRTSGAGSESPRPWRNDFAMLREMLRDGSIKPAIDRQYPLELTAEAHRYVDSGRKKGNVVITVG